MLLKSFAEFLSESKGLSSVVTPAGNIIGHIARQGRSKIHIGYHQSGKQFHGNSAAAVKKQIMKHHVDSHFARKK